MTRRRHRIDLPEPSGTQMSIAFPTKQVLDAKQRAEVVAIVSRLLLQVARAQQRDEVDDDRS